MIRERLGFSRLSGCLGENDSKLKVLNGAMDREKPTSDITQGTAPHNNARAGFGVAPILYMLGLIGVGAGLLFSSYSQSVKGNIQMTNSFSVKSDLEAAATTLAATSVLGATDPGTLCPPQGGVDTVGSNCVSAPDKMVEIYPTMNVTLPDAHLPTNYAVSHASGSPVEVGIFTSGAGVKQLDPWGHYYIYCRWESQANSSNPAIQILSAGSTGVLNTSCGATTASTTPDNYAINMNASVAVNRSAVWQTGTIGSSTPDIYYGTVGHQLTVDANGNLTVPGNATVDGSYTSPGNITSTAGNLSAVGGAFSGSLGVTGDLSAENGAVATASGGTLSATNGAFAVNSGGVISAASGTFLVGSGGTISASNGAFTVDNTGSLTIGTGGFSVTAATGNTNVSGTLNVGGVLATTAAANFGTNTAPSGASLPLISVGKKVGTTYPFSVDQFGTVTAPTFIGDLSGNVTGGTISGVINATTITASGNYTSSAGNITIGGIVTAGGFSGTLSLGGGGSGVTLSGVVPIANGGTNASDAADAIANLGVTSGGYLNTALLTSNLIPGADLVNNSVTINQLNTTGVTAGTYNWGTVTADGRVTAAQNVSTSNSINDQNGDIVAVGSSAITFTVGSTGVGTWNYTGLMVGTNSPTAKDKLDVYGNEAIGKDYAGTIAAPLNGLIVEGSVGIGTSAPTSALTVNGTITATNFSGSGAGLTSIGTSAITGILSPANGGTGINNGNNTLTLPGGSITLGTASLAGQVAYYSGTNTLAGTSDMYISSLNVGIGTASPTVSLDLSARTDALALPVGTTGQEPIGPNGMIRYNASTPAIEAYVNGVWTTLASASSLGSITLGSSSTLTNPSRSGDVTTGLYSDAVGTVEISSAGTKTFSSNTTYTLIPVGAVGIGTLSPTQPLSVVGSVGVDEGNNNIGTPANFLQFGGVAAGEGIGSKKSTGGNQFGLDFYTGSTNRMAISNAGFVGIGSTIPVASLDLSQKTDALAMPVGTTGTRPATSINGMMRYNQTNAKFEAYQGGTWQDILTSNGGNGLTLGTSASSTNPSRNGDITTGLYSDAAGTVEISSAGTQTLSSNSTYTLIPTGSVGIGIATPDSKLEVSGTVPYTGTNTSEMLHVNATSNNAGSTNEDGLYALNTVNPAVAPIVAYSPYGILGSVQTSSANVNNFVILTAVGGNAVNTYTGISNAAFYGTQSSAANASTGTIATMIGVRGVSDNQSTGTISSASGGTFSIKNDVAGAITNGYGVNILSPINAGTIGTTYGLYINSQTIGTQTNAPYALYQAGASDKNYFAGNVGIGTTSPATRLEVAGASVAGVATTGVTSNASMRVSGTGSTSVLDIGIKGGGNNYTYLQSTSSADLSQTQWLVLNPNGGNVGIGSTSPRVSLDLSQRTDALALPSGNTGQEPVGPNGMIRYNSTTPAVEAYVNNAWTSLLSSSSLGSGLTLGTSASKTNPQKSGDVTTGLYSDAAATVEVAASGTPVVSFTTSGVNITTGGLNIASVNGLSFPADFNTDASIAIGSGALAYQALGTAAQNNIAIGYQALSSSGLTTAAYNNIAVGYRVLNNNTSGNTNTGMGVIALTSNTTGFSNSGFGAGALRQNTVGSNNTAAGYSSLYYNTTGGNNTAMGAYAMIGVLGSELTGSNNIAMGVNALHQIETTAASNTAIGANALYYNTTGATNTAVGAAAMNGVSGSELTGTNNVALGANALYQIQTTANNNSAVGYNALYYNSVAGSNTAMGYKAIQGSSLVALTGGGNTAMGASSLVQLQGAAANNTAFGNGVGHALTTGSNNTLLGYSVGSSTLATGSNNILIGTSSSVDTPATNTSNFLNIGNVIFATGMTGTVGVPVGSVGIGTVSPVYAMDIYQNSGADLHEYIHNVYAGAGAYLNIAANSNYATVSMAGSTQGWSVGEGGTTNFAVNDVTNGNLKPLSIESGTPTGTLYLKSTGLVGIGSTIPVASLDLSQKTDALAMPVGTTGQRPGTSVNGMMRYNQTNGKFEAYQSGTWQDILTSNTSNGLTLGTSASSTNPSRNGDITTGLYSDAAGTVEISSAGTQTLSSNSTQTLIPVGNVGIGSTAPLAIIDAKGNIPAAGNAYNFTSTSTGLSTTENGLASTLTYSPTSAPVGTSTINGLSSVVTSTSANANSFSVLQGLSNSVSYSNATGTLGFAKGTFTSAKNQAAGTITSAYGLQSQAINNSTGTITNGYAGNFGVLNNSAGTITNAYGLYVFSPTNAGTLGFTYGLYVMSQTAGTQTHTPYGIYQAGGSDLNYFAGKIGVGSTSPTVSLDMSKETDALALPAGTTGQEPVGPNGMIRYNSTTPGIEAYVNNAWTSLAASSSLGSISLGTSAATTNPSRSGDITTGLYTAGAHLVDVAANGVQVEEWSTTGVNITTGGLNIGGQNGITYPTNDTTTDGSIGIGSGALTHQGALAAAAYRNTAVGYQAIGGVSLGTTAINNTAVGFSTLSALTTGSGNTAVGVKALTANTIGANNSAFGNNALVTNTGNQNSALGFSALNNNTSGNSNTAVGFDALFLNTTGANNTVLGNQVASTTLTTGSSNILIGTSNAVDTPATNTSNFLNIGNVIFATGMTGTLGVPVGSVGIGTVSPVYAMDIYQNTNADLHEFIHNAYAGAGSYLNISANSNYAAVGLTSPTQGWTIGEMGSTSFVIKDGTNSTIPLTIQSSTPTNTLYLAASGFVGIGSTIPVASLDLSQKTDALAMPVGTTGQRPGTSVNGMMRYNQTNGKFEAYQSGTWQDILTSNTSNGLTLGTSASSTNPSRNGDITTGLYSDAAGTVEISSAGTQTLSSNSTYTLIPTGSVGIGTATPSSALSVWAGNLPTAASNAAGVFLNATSTNAGAPTDNGLYSGVTAAPAVAPTTAYSINGIQGLAGGGSANINTKVTAVGVSGYGQYSNATGTISTIQGVNGSAQNNGTGTAANATGVNGYVKNATTGTITNANGGNFNVNNTTTGLIGNAYGVNIQSPGNNGTITNTIGLYIASQTAGTQTHTPYGIYQAGGSDLNYFAGKIGVGSTSPTVSLDVSKETDALALPAGTTGQEPVGPNGMIRYNSTTPGIEAYVNNAWTSLAASSSLGSISLGTSASTTNPSRSGDITTGLYTAGAHLVDVAANGVQVEEWSTTGVNIATGGLNINGGNGISFPQDVFAGNSVAIGSGALAYQPLGTTGLVNTAVGYRVLGSSGLTTAAADNTGVGYFALSANTSGNTNTGIGASALLNNTAGSSNSAEGYSALRGNTTGSNSTALGADALFYNTTGSSNTAVGGSAIAGVSGTPLTGSGNTGIGANALYQIQGASVNNTALGYQAGKALTTGGSNLILGFNVGSATLSTGSNNILVGTSGAVDTPATNTSNFLNIGNLIYGTSIGTQGQGSVGIGTASPSTTLDVYGTNGDVLRADGTNNRIVIGSSTIGNYDTMTVIGTGLRVATYGNAGSGQVNFGQAATPISILGNPTYGFRFSTGSTSNAVTFADNGNVGIGTTSPAVSLDLSYKTDAVALPVGTTGQRPTGANGMVRYNATIPGLEAYVNGSWLPLLSSGGSGASLNLGSSAIVTNPSRTGDVTTGLYTAGAGLVDVANSGVQSAEFSTSGVNITTGGLNIAGVNGISFPKDFTTDASIAIGSGALASQTLGAGTQANVAVGYQALGSTGLTTAAVSNTVVGYQAGKAVTSGNLNVFLGYQAGLTMISGQYNTAIGQSAAIGNTSGIGCTAIGSGAAACNAGGSFDTSIGNNAASSGNESIAIGPSASATGNASFALGYGASVSNTNDFAMGTSQKLSGTNSLLINTTGTSQTMSGNNLVVLGGGNGSLSGSNNTLVGYQVGSTTLTTGSNNILLGTTSAVDTPAAGTSNFLNIANVIYGTSIGTAGQGSVGIGTAAPAATMDVRGNVQVGNSGQNYIKLYAASLMNSFVTNEYGGLMLGNNTMDGVLFDQAFHAASAINFSNGQVQIETAASAATPTWTTALTVITSGAVGIGTTSPAQTLDVAGAAKVAGNTATCSSATIGSMHFNSTNGYMEICQ